MKLTPIAILISIFVVNGCSDTPASKTETESSAVKTRNADHQQTDTITSILAVEQVPPQVPEATLATTQSERFNQFVEKVKQLAAAEGVSQTTLDKAFTNVHLVLRVIASDKNQLEKKITLDDYLKRVLTTRRISQAKENYQLYSKQLATPAQRYGVPASYIVALWGMESSFGRLQGKEEIISAMTTLAFEGRREAFFTKELIAALKIVDQGHIDIGELKGSWAGAMGQSQFMPSSFIKYAADGDGDGRIDIWSNVNDVFASIANYLSTEGWDPTLTWGREVQLSATVDVAKAGLEDEKAMTIAQWQQQGITVKNIDPAELKQKAWLILPDDAQGRAFLVSSNFKTLMHWNRSYYFAISVGMLADSISSIK